MNKDLPPDWNYYVDNKKLLEVYSIWRKLAFQEREAGREDPQMPTYVAESIMAIANGLSHKSNFNGYSWRDEMVSDAIENCFKYKFNFDPEKSSSIFSYFTTICYYSFLSRIKIEKKQSYIKSKLIQQLPIEDLIEIENSSEVPSDILNFIRMNNYVETEEFESKTNKTKKTESKLKTAQLEVNDCENA